MGMSTFNILFVKLIQNTALFFTSVPFEGQNIVSTTINVKINQRNYEKIIYKSDVDFDSIYR